jgi:hypothetical protein
MNLKPKDIVVVSGAGRTESWERDLQGTVLKVDENTNSVFVIWHGTCVEDEMKPEELIKVGENKDFPPTDKLLKVTGEPVTYH